MRRGRERGCNALFAVVPCKRNFTLHNDPSPKYETVVPLSPRNERAVLPGAGWSLVFNDVGVWLAKCERDHPDAKQTSQH